MGGADTGPEAEVLFEICWRKAHPQVGVTPIPAAPLPTARVAAPLEGPACACSEPKPTWVTQKAQGSASYSSQSVQSPAHF